MESISSLIPFFIILSAGLFFTDFFKRIHLPYVSALIIAGIVIGPFGLNIIELSETIQFLGGIGLVFLMFIAGTEANISSLKNLDKNILWFVILNGGIPFLAGFGVAQLIDLTLVGSVVLGITFISTSIAVVIPSLEANNLLNGRVGKVVLPGTILQDISSLVFLSIVLQSQSDDNFLPWPLQVCLFAVVIVILKYLIPELERLFHMGKEGQDLFESELRFTIAILLGSAIIFELLGLSSIIAGFIIGVFLRDYIKKEKVEGKIRTISYGVFIPSFFLSIGMSLNFDEILSPDSIQIPILIVLGLILSKFVASIVFSSLLKENINDGLLYGSLTIPQLSTTLAAALAAQEVGLLNEQVTSSLILLSLISVLISPILVRIFISNDETVKDTSIMIIEDKDEGV